MATAMRGRAVIGSIGKALIGLCFSLLLLGYSAAQAQTYSESFVQSTSYGAGTPQQDNWTSFKASLPTSGLNSIKINGSRDTTGYICTNAPLAQQIADNLRNGTAATVVCGGQNWSTGSCGSVTELAVGATSGVCQCGTNYTIRPHSTLSSNWGGINGTTCGAVTQTMAVSFNTDIIDQDYSDAPTSGTNYSYAVHEIVSGVQLGAAIDADAGLIGNSDASGDGSDDDGIVIPQLIELGSSTITATVSGAGGFLQGWIDWNGDGDFDDSGEQVAINLQDTNSDGVISVPVTVPFNTTSSQTFARFRWSTTASLTSNAYSTSGEVEDYALTIDQLTGGSALAYSEDFVQSTSYGAGTPQQDNWLSFKAGLPTSGLTSIQINGSRDTTGYVCLDTPLVQEIANNLRNGTAATVACGGQNWSTGSCGSVTELSVGATSGVCQCGSNYTLRPHSSLSTNWGGINGTTCGATTQSMAVSFNNADVDRDYSDAPTSGTNYGYAIHELVSGLQLGAAIDADAGLIGNSDASGDGADDDGVVIPQLIESGTTTITATVSGAGGYLQGWIDWNADGDFDDPDEQIALDLQDSDSDGIISIPVTVPFDGASGQTFARFRWSTTASLSSTAYSTSGEVEDYTLTIIELTGSITPFYSEDFVQSASYGAGTPQQDNWLSFKAGLPTSGLNNIRISGSLDTVGYVCTDPASVQAIANNLRTGAAATVACGGQNWSTGSCGSVTELSVGATSGVCQCGSNYTLRPHSSLSSNWGGINGTTCGATSQTMSVGFNLLDPLLDYSDAPTTSTNYLDAVHEVISGVQLGAAIDTESGPLGNSDASGDGADDDGITIPSLAQSVTASFTATVSGASGYLQGWIDWNGDGDFTDSGEQIATDLRDDGSADDVASGDGIIQFDVAVPASTTTNQTFARFRWSNSSGLNSADPTNSGEVEDYAVTIVGNPLSVTSTADTNTTGTLRAAITYANANAGDDAITFDIAGTGPHVITLTSALPTLSDDGISIDGSSQSGASCGDLWAGTPHVLEIVIDANGGALDVLSIAGNNIAIRGLSLVGAANVQSGVYITPTSDAAAISCSYIGLLPDGTADSNIYGIASRGANAMIGGSGSGDGNVISGNVNDGILLFLGNSGTSIEGNFIGTDPLGATADANGRYGVSNVISTAGSITINEIRKNLISGNAEHGIRFTNVNSVSGSSGDVVIAGNYIGVDRTGATALANGSDGIEFASGSISGVTIGGSTAFDSNIISRNLGDGIDLDSLTDVTILGNYIGTDATGSISLGNTLTGVKATSVTGLTIGDGTVSGSNKITHSGATGIAISASSSAVILGNNIHSNVGIGIDLDGDGVTVNDSGDSDGGANALLNFPVLNSLATDGSTTITYDFNLDVPTNAQGYRIDFYKNSAAHATGYGEGETHLGSIDIAHSGGDQRFTGTFTATGAVAQGALISATTTRKTAAAAYDITSEFSLSFAGGAPAALTTEISTIVFDPGSAGLFAVPGNDVITTMTVTNTGAGPVDSSSITLFGAVPGASSFRNDDIEDGGPETDPVSFTQSAGAGLSFTYATDVRYSDSGSEPADFASCVYTPSAGYDANVRFICVNPKGALAAGDPDPNFFVSFRTQIN